MNTEELRESIIRRILAMTDEQVEQILKQLPK